MAFASVYLVLVVSALVWLGSKYVGQRQAIQRNLENSKALGCKDPPLIQSKWPLNLDLILQVLQAAREKRILALYQKVVEDDALTTQERMLGTKAINTLEPENVEVVLSTKFENFGLGQRRAMFLPLLGDAIFTQDGAAWKHSRAMLRPQFQINRTDTYDEIRLQTKNLISHIEEGKAVDLQPLFFGLTLSTTLYLIFGRSIDAFGTGPDAKATKEFADAFTDAQDWLAHRARVGPLYWVVDGFAFRRSCKKVHDYVDNIINEAMAKDAPASNEKSFLDALIQETRDKKVLRYQLLNILLAGRDTTAAILGWTFRLLACNRPVLEKLRAEIESVYGLGPGSSDPTREDIKKLPYLNMVIKEVLRLYPSVPVNSRLTNKTTILPTGGGEDGKQPILLEPGVPVAWSPYIIQRRKDLYGPDADSFRPERWDPEAKKWNLNDIGWGFMPFNKGPRICLGQDFAWFEASYATVKILQEFSQLLIPPGHHIEAPGKEAQLLTLTLSSADGCVLDLRREPPRRSTRNAQ